MTVVAATQAFNSELRLQLIRHFSAQPGIQAEAMRALGVSRALVQYNVRALVETGVLVESPVSHPRQLVLSVDQERFEQLLEAIRAFGAGDPF